LFSDYIKNEFISPFQFQKSVQNRGLKKLRNEKMENSSAYIWYLCLQRRKQL